MDENAEVELEQARNALTDASVLLTGDGTDAGVVEFVDRMHDLVDDETPD